MGRLLSHTSLVIFFKTFFFQNQNQKSLRIAPGAATILPFIQWDI